MLEALPEMLLFAGQRHALQSGPRHRTRCSRVRCTGSRRDRFVLAGSVLRSAGMSGNDG
jgi:hypothetical protein